MNDQVPTALVKLWRDIETGVPPLDELVERGRRGRRRRRLLTSTALVAALLVLGGSAWAIQAHSADPTDHAPNVAPVDGGFAREPTRLVGFRGITAAVPRSWITQQPICQRPAVPYVFFASHAVYNCWNETRPAPKPVASVQLGSIRGSGVDESTLSHGRFQAGLYLRYGDMRCRAVLCRETFVADGVAFIVWARKDEAHRLIAAIGGTIARVPAGHACVPYIEPGTDAYTGEQRVKAAGFRVAQKGHAYNSMVEAVHPDAGTVLPRGSVVTVRVM